MKIAIDCRMLGSGGIGTYIAELIPLFLEKNDCLLIGKEKDIVLYKNNPNAKLCSCSIPPFSFRELIAFPKAITGRINTCDAYYTPYCNIPSGIKIPVFSTIHDVVFLDVPGLASKNGTAVRKWFYKRAVEKSRAIFTVSHFSEDRIKTQLHCRKPIIVTFSAVPSWLRPDTDNTVQKNGTVLFVGNIKKHKGLHLLLPAFQEAIQNGFASQLVIVGNSDNFRTDDDSIRQEIDTMPADLVRFTGKVSDAQLRQLYLQASLLVQPSLYEGFGLPPLEALTLGTNALISDIPVFREIYSMYPVSFFKTGDTADLASKLISTAALPPPLNIPQLYSFSRTYSLISAAIDFYRA
jgi:glycosyltransferase involved in cell wall biosynthesis